MWVFNQKTGEIRHDNLLVDVGYAGAGSGKDNPEMEAIKNVGPLPCGHYTLGEVKEGTHMGLYAVELIPEPTNRMFGRNGFYWHGDNGNGTASEGCIVSSFRARKQAKESGDKLEVISGEEEG